MSNIESEFDGLRANSSTSIDDPTSTSTQTFLAALWLNGAICLAEVLAFTFLRTRFKAIYQPRTYIPPKSKRSPLMPTGLWTWPMAIWNLDYKLIKIQNGLDSYFFVRYLRMMVKIFLPIWFLSWTILLPITSVKSTGPAHSGLDMFTFGNVGTSQQSRYAAHTVLVYIFTIWVFYVIKGEMRHFVTTRQHYLVDEKHSASAQANTVLITGIPSSYLTEAALRGLFSHLPGGVKKVWLNRDLKDLPDIYKRRLKATDMLEKAQTKLIRTATKLRNAELKKQAKNQTDASASKDGLTVDATSPDVEKNLSRSEQLVPANMRPTHRVGSSIPFMGTKVDTIEWLREQIAKDTEELEAKRKIMRQELSDEQVARVGGVTGVAKRIIGTGEVEEEVDEVDEEIEDSDDEGKAKTGTKEKVASPTAEGNGEGGSKKEKELEVDARPYPPLNSAFILFHQQIAAHMAYQVLTHSEPYRMAEKHIEVAPADVIWGNLGLNPYEMKIRMGLSYLATAALILLWAIPVAFVGIVSNVGNLCKTYSWLAWLCDIPNPVLGILQGVLPPVLLAVLFMLLPIVLRLLARIEGIPRRTGLELSLMTRYFMFQVLHGFLIVTLSSGIIAALPGIVKDPGSIPTLLASNLPKASNFFLTYALLQGLTGTASGFLQIGPLITYYVKLVLLGSTPRSVYNIKYTMQSVAWGTLFPTITLITVIAFGYSIIAPIMNGLACATFFAYYMMYKYLFLYQFDQPASTDTGGLFFPKAIQHLFVGLYIQQICLAALFFLAQNQHNKPSAIPEGILMIVLIVITAAYHFIINHSYDPLLHCMPLTHAHKSHGMPKDGEDQGPVGADVSASGAEVVDEDGLRRRGRTQVESGAGMEGYDVDGPRGGRRVSGVMEVDETPRNSRGVSGVYGPARDSRRVSGVDGTARNSRAVGGVDGTPRNSRPISGVDGTARNSRPISGVDGTSRNSRPISGAVDGVDEKRRTVGGVDESAHTVEDDEMVETGFGKARASEEGLGVVDEPTDFYHPAAAEPQRVVWLPRDTLGVAEAEEKANMAYRLGGEVDESKRESKAEGEGVVEGESKGKDEGVVEGAAGESAGESDGAGAGAGTVEEPKGDRAAPVETSTRNATMDAEGKVDISGPPPEEGEEE